MPKSDRKGGTSFLIITECHSTTIKIHYFTLTLLKRFRSIGKLYNEMSKELAEGKSEIGIKFPYKQVTQQTKM